MRTLIVLLAIGLAGPAEAQADFALTLQRDAEVRAQAEAAQRREVELYNRLSTLEARQQTEQALRDIDALRFRAPIVAPAPGASGPSSEGKLASIPDDRLAASNARVRAAAANRR